MRPRQAIVEFFNSLDGCEVEVNAQSGLTYAVLEQQSGGCNIALEHLFYLVEQATRSETMDAEFPKPEDYRIYLAGQIMPAIVVDAMRHNAQLEHPHDAVSFDEMATKAVVAADALIAALKR